MKPFASAEYQNAMPPEWAAMLFAEVGPWPMLTALDRASLNRAQSPMAGTSRRCGDAPSEDPGVPTREWPGSETAET